jgi:non-canonical purine NTP pyrophosphatase (RdgB/HAM1 family)
MHLLVATTNPNKVKEIRQLLDGANVEVITLDGWPDLVAPEETGRTFEDNARLKAIYYARATGQLTVAEDSGIEIDALGGAPGVESARYAGEETSYPEKFARLYAALDRTGSRDSAARFVCALAMASPDAILFEARGVIEGRVAQEPAGSGGFGYDPFFFYPPYGRTLGQVTPAEKLAVSHRGQAFRKLREHLDRERKER